MTEKLRTQLVISVVIVQMLFFVGWYANEAGAFNQPIAKIMVKTIAYDPRNLLSGQYIRLRYNFSNPRGRWDSELERIIFSDSGDNINDSRTSDQYPPDRVEKNTDIWVILHEVDGFYEPKTAYFLQPAKHANGEVVLKGRSTGSKGIKYGIEKYFVPEGTKEPKREDITVELNVYKNGKVRINQVFVKNRVWP